MDGNGILCVGNAIVDAHVRRGERRPTAEEVAALRATGSLGAAVAALRDEGEDLSPGGSAANTAAELARLGVRTTFVGRAGDDEAGRLCRGSLEAVGVRWATPLAAGGRTSRIHLYVDEAGERSFVAELDACRGLGADDVRAARDAATSAVLVEAYLIDDVAAAFDAAIDVARADGAYCAVTLGSAAVAARHAGELRALAEAGLVDLLVGNEEEFVALVGDAEPVSAMGDMRCTCVMTRGTRAPIATRRGTITKGERPREAEVVDTTGAGDAFAAGLLSVLARGGPMGEALALGTLLGTVAVGRRGARAPWRA